MCSFRLRAVDISLVPRVLEFYDGHPSEFLWPRDFAELSNMAEDGELFCCQADPHDRIVGACYLKAEDTRSEFGGILVDESVRGLGVGTFLARVAIATAMAQSSEVPDLIAHVHEDNDLPRGMLQRLGFFDTESPERLPDNMAPPSMKRSAEGDVVGDVFEFGAAGYDALADFVSQFSGQLQGTAGVSEAHIEISIWHRFRTEMATALQALGRASERS